MANSQSSAAWAGGPTANPEASTVAAQVLRKSAIPVRRVALRASRAGRPAPIMSRLHDAEPELEGIEGRDQSLQLRLVPIEFDVACADCISQRDLLENYSVPSIACQGNRCVDRKSTRPNSSHQCAPRM